MHSPIQSLRSLAPVLVPMAVVALLVDLGAQRRRRQPRAAVALEHLSFEAKSFDSKALGRRVRYGLYLPKDYAKDKKQRYPLVIYLHGMFEDHRRFHERGGAPVLDRLVGKKALPKLVFVCPNGGRSSFYINGKNSGAYEDMIAVDLLAHLQKTYRLKQGRGARALMGVSMGGQGALKIAFKRPGLFGVVAAHSAAILPKDPDRVEEVFPWIRRYGGTRRALGGVFGDPVDRKLWEKENPLCLAEALEPEALKGLGIYFDCGSRDRYGFDAPNRRLHEILKQKGIPHEWRLVEDGNHGWRSGYNQGVLPDSLAFVARAWTRGEATKGLEKPLPPGPTVGPTSRPAKKIK